MQTAAALRLAFDQSFAHEPAPPNEPLADYLSIMLGDAQYALPMQQLGGLHAGIEIVPCPSAAPELLGLAGLRGTITPIYDLAALLGLTRGGQHWVAISADRLLGFAFDRFEGHFYAKPCTSVSDAQTPQIVSTDDRSWPLVDLASLAAGLARRTQDVSLDNGVT